MSERSRAWVRTGWRIGVPLATISLLVWQWISWPALQDDALIHLRFADRLLHEHRVTYNGGTTEFGASSLLYIALLAGLRAITTSPVLPRAVSTAGHLLLFVALIALGIRRFRRWPATASLAALVLVGVLAGPSSVRWLDDGMETSLVLCLSAFLAWLLVRLSRVERVGLQGSVSLALLGFVAVLLRVELLLLLGFAGLMLAIERWRLIPLWRGEESTKGSRITALLPSATLVAGGLLAAAFIRATIGALLPDTALAKSFGLGHWYWTLIDTRIVFLSAMALGGLSLGLWLLTAVLLLRQRGFGLALLLANALFPVVLALAAVRGQAIQGIRYFEWTLLFPIVWNLLELAEDSPSAVLLRFDSDPGFRYREPQPGRMTFAYRVLSGVTVLFLVALLAAQPFEARLLGPVFTMRSETLAQFRAQHLERLKTIPVAAFDVGYIGYFTDAPLCDTAGLVNGRAVAQMSYDARLQRCAAAHPGMAFGNTDQLDDLNFRLSLIHWQICAEYDLANLRSVDRHYLVASPDAAPAVCAAAGGSPRPLLPMLPPGSK